MGMELTIRPLLERELSEADTIFRLAFGTFMGLPDPMTFGGDSDFVATRWRADPAASFAALQGDRLVGSNFAARWGSFGFFGPLTVRVELWDRGIARRLLDATMQRFDEWRTPYRGLFTFAQSAKHVSLYQRYGFYPRFLTPIMAKPLAAGVGAAPHSQQLSRLAPAEREAAVRECAAISGAIFEGLDLGVEIDAVQAQQLGDTVLSTGDGAVRGFAVCHVGPRTEAGSGVCYAKFAAVRPGADAGNDFEQLLAALESYAAERGATQVVAGVNTAREGAYRRMLARGYRTMMQGVAMHSPNEPLFNRPDAYVLDDWR
jgi:GNAT superfamily N-acetyltransferase